MKILHRSSTSLSDILLLIEARFEITLSEVLSNAPGHLFVEFSEFCPEKLSIFSVSLVTYPVCILWPVFQIRNRFSKHWRR